MNKKILFAFVAVVVIALGIILVYSFDSLSSPIIDDSNSSVLLNGSIETAENVVDANNLFAFDLYSILNKQEDNVFYSPYSISSAIAMTYEGAKGQTADEIKQVFYFPESEVMRGGFANINQKYNEGSLYYNLSIANALWIEKTYPFSSDYLKIISDYYGGKATNLDFIKETEKSRIVINNWVEEKTNDKIKNLIPVGLLTPMTRMVLTNAVYFKANWSKQFDAEDTYDKQFETLTGNKTIKMMHQTSHFSYGENKDLQILEMDYLGNNLSMLVILPKNDMSKVEDNLKGNLESWKKKMKDERVSVSLPKFKFETKYFMGNDLKEMGMPTAFSGDADFSGMSLAGDLYIGEVIHQTFIEVAEYGTEAAAATAVVMKTFTGPGNYEEPKYFIADHPFIFVIQDKSTGNILFMGKMNDPSE